MRAEATDYIGDRLFGTSIISAKSQRNNTHAIQRASHRGLGHRARLAD